VDEELDEELSDNESEEVDTDEWEDRHIVGHP